MTDKRIKNEQWYIKELVSKISNGDISKPKFQKNGILHLKKIVIQMNNLIYDSYLIHIIVFMQLHLGKTLIRGK